MFNNRILLKYPYLVHAEFWLGTPCICSCFWHREIFVTSVLDLMTACSMCRGWCKSELQPPDSFSVVAFSHSCSLHHFFLSSLSFFPHCPWQNGFEPLFVFEIDNNTNTIKRRPGTRKQVKSMRLLVLWLSLLCCAVSPSLCPLLAVCILTPSS